MTMSCMYTAKDKPTLDLSLNLHCPNPLSLPGLENSAVHLLVAITMSQTMKEMC